MPIDPSAINEAPTLWHAVIVGLFLLAAYYLEGKTIVELARVVLREGVTPNIGFISKSLLFIVLVISSLISSKYIGDTILTLSFIGCFAILLYMVYDQGKERLHRDKIRKQRTLGTITHYQAKP